MSTPFQNCVTGHRTGVLPETLVPGLWQVVQERQDSVAIRLHGHLIDQLRVAVTAGVRPEVTWQVEGRARGHSYFDPKLLPDDTTVGSVREIVEPLGESVEWASSWDELCAVCPVPPGVSDRAQLTPLERRIIQWLKHLEAVCQRPRSQLSVETERVHVARAKRLASSAAEFLASHTEDWHHRTLRGVEPKRILAVTMDEDFDIYENRVAARLVDLLLDHVTRRVAELSRVRWLFEDRHDFAKQAGGMHWRQNRIYELWGEAFVGGDDFIREQAQSSLKELKELRQRLLKLLDSRLYRAVPRQRTVPSSLRMTNILASDQHYKWVARLWLVRHQLAVVPVADEAECVRKHQTAVTNWQSFVVLLVVRALDQFGYRPVHESRVVRRGGGSVEISNSRRAIALSWEVSGVVVIREAVSGGGADRVLKIVPLAAALSRGADESIVERVLREIGVLSTRTQSVPDTAGRSERHVGRQRPTARRPEADEEASVVVVYPGVSQERANYSPHIQWALQTLQNDGASGPSGTTRLVPVSPLAVDSLERIGRALRWWLASSWSERYPPQRRAEKTTIAQLRDFLPSGVRGDSDGLLIVHGRLAREEIAQSESNCRRRLLAAAGVNRGIPSLEASISEVFSWIADTERTFRDFFTCSICGTEADRRHVEARSNGLVACSCGSCSASWGIRACSSCGSRFPYLRPYGDVGPLDSNEVGWVDRVFGRDVLAVPRPELGAEAFRCPACGK